MELMHGNYEWNRYYVSEYSFVWRCIEIKNEIIKYISAIIDNVGYEEFCNFLDTACKIKNVLKEGGYID